MSKELDDAYFRSTPCTYYEPLLSKLVDCVDLLEERIKGLLGANVYVGDTDTLPAGSEATVSASKRGYDTMLEFGIPKGEKGDPGAAGSQGPAGPQGPKGEKGDPGIDADKVYIMQKQIENLQGIVATEETDSTEAYTKTVPTGAQKWASLDKVGGKTVVWNQLLNAIFNGSLETGLSISCSNGLMTVSGTTYGNGGRTTPITSHFEMKAGHMYMWLFNVVSGSFTEFIGYFNNSATNTVVKALTENNHDCLTETIFSVQESATCYLGFNVITNTEYSFSGYPQLFDLTQMFGAGNEPSTVEDFRAMFPADYYPYNPGELMSAEVVEVESKGKNLAIVDTFPIPQSVREMCPGYGWSAGTACNEIDFGRKVYVQKVDSVDLGTLNWNADTRYDNVQFYSGSIADKTIAAGGCICAKYSWVKNQGWQSNVNKTIGFVGGAHQLLIVDNDYQDAGAFKAAMAGVLLYYELAEPIEVDLSGVLSDDNFIEVEAGGTVTFKQASTQLPVPSSVTYQISTKEAIANA